MTNDCVQPFKRSARRGAKPQVSPEKTLSVVLRGSNCDFACGSPCHGRRLLVKPCALF
jgi:hypothetical protein